MSRPSQQWTPDYAQLVERNIGLLSEEQQEHLRRSQVSVPGMGGLGGTVFEVLVRCGIGRFSIVDKDIFDPTNMNRQIFSFRHTVGRRKIDVAEEFAKGINPDVEIRKYDRVGEDNVEEILCGSDVIVQGIDQLRPCLILSRKAREMDIPLVEGWALPYGNVRTITSETPSLEEIYGLPTLGRSISDISDAEFKELGFQVLLGLADMKGVSEFYNENARRRAVEGRITSFAPLVWLAAVLMALEAVKVLLDWGQIALAPAFALYDPFLHRIPEQPAPAGD